MNNAATLDLTQLAADLGDAGRKADEKIQRMLESTGDEIAADMRNRAPVKTGMLQSSIQVQSSYMQVVIGPTVFYAVYVEFGTGTRGEFPTGPYIIKPKMANELAFKMNGKWVFTKQVVHPGIRPKPFARPAVEDFLNRLGERAADIGVEVLKGPSA